MNLRKRIAFIMLAMILGIPGTKVFAADIEINLTDTVDLEELSIEEKAEDSKGEPEGQAEAIDENEKEEAEIKKDEATEKDGNPKKDETTEKVIDNMEVSDKETPDTVAKEEVKQETAKVETKKETGSAVKKSAYTDAELRLMSAIILCEAGNEPYAGKLAVGIVVMNRKRSKSFPNTIKEVVYQKNQFSPVKNGALAKALKNYDNGNFTSEARTECIKAAKAALEGAKEITYKKKTYDFSKYLYFNGKVRNYKLQIASHQFK